MAVFSKLPLAMPLQLALALAPWAAVAATGSFASLLAVAGVAAGYTLLLFTQLWRLRAELRDSPRRPGRSSVPLAVSVVSLESSVERNRRANCRKESGFLRFLFA